MASPASAAGVTIRVALSTSRAVGVFAAASAALDRVMGDTSGTLQHRSPGSFRPAPCNGTAHRPLHTWADIAGGAARPGEPMSGLAWSEHHAHGDELGIAGRPGDVGLQRRHGLVHDRV